MDFVKSQQKGLRFTYTSFSVCAAFMELIIPQPTTKNNRDKHAALSCDKWEYCMKCLKLAGLCWLQLWNPLKARPLQNDNAHTSSCPRWNACTAPTSASQRTEEKHKCAILHTLCETGLTTYAGFGRHGSKSKRGIFVEFDTFSEKEKMDIY